MLIVLDDPIWTRLYGPYGVEDVAGVLRSLSDRWDEAAAQDLFWEKLHHQETLYPATFAALPWVWKLAPRPLEASAQTPLFLSHVLDCAFSIEGTGPHEGQPQGRYQGLATDVSAHQWDWLPAEQRLRPEDMVVLERLETWFAQTAPEMANACVGLVSGQDRFMDANLLRGPAALVGAALLPGALTMWGDEHDVQGILAVPPETAEDRSAALSLAGRITPRSPDLTRFLQDWAAM
jgi:hypothetical protein